MGRYEMLAEKCLKRLLNHDKDSVQIAVGNSQVQMKALESNTKLELTANVYQGENFIPVSVRKCIFQAMPFQSWLLQTHLTIDERKYQIHLNYINSLKDIRQHNGLRETIEEFAKVADEWRFRLDEHDKHDLLPVYVRN